MRNRDTHTGHTHRQHSAAQRQVWACYFACIPRYAWHPYNAEPLLKLGVRSTFKFHSPYKILVDCCHCSLCGQITSIFKLPLWIMVSTHHHLTLNHTSLLNSLGISSSIFTACPTNSVFNKISKSMPCSKSALHMPANLWLLSLALIL